MPLLTKFTMSYLLHVCVIMYVRLYICNIHDVNTVNKVVFRVNYNLMALNR